MEESAVRRMAPLETPDVKNAGKGGSRKKGAFLVLGLLVISGAFAFHLVARRPVTTLVPVPVPVPAAVDVTKRFPRFERNILVIDTKTKEDLKDLNPETSTKAILDPLPLVAPRGISASLDGSVFFVADTETVAISVFDASGKALFSLRGEGQGRLQLPVSVASNLEGRMYVVDRIQNRVAMYSPHGDFIGNFWPQNMPTSFKMAPLSVAFDRAGNMYLGDGEGPAYVFDKTGALKLRLAPPEGGFMGAYGIAVNSSGVVAVTDTNRGRVLTFKPNGELDRIIEGFGLPRGVAIDDDGNIFVADTLGHEIAMYNSQGQRFHGFGQWGTLEGQVEFPDSVALDGKGRILVSDRGNHRAQIWSY